MSREEVYAAVLDILRALGLDEYRRYVPFCAEATWQAITNSGAMYADFMREICTKTAEVTGGRTDQNVAKGIKRASVRSFGRDEGKNARAVFGLPRSYISVPSPKEFIEMLVKKVTEG